MKATPLNFTSILPVEGTINTYVIPKYQREYSWGTDNWEKLYQDIMEFDGINGYYMGSLICIQQETIPNYLPTYNLVDGQQRITTLSILLAAIYKKFKNSIAEIKDEDDVDEYKSILRNIGNRIVYRAKISSSTLDEFIAKDDKYKYYIRLTLSSQNYNFDDYLYLLSECSLIPARNKPLYFGNRRISKAFQYFYKQLPESIDKLLILLDKINLLNFVYILADDYSDAYMLFETLNNRGLPLTAMDIIKNKLLSKFIEDIDEAYDKWQQILLNLPEENNRDRFFRHYYNAFKQNEKIKIEGIGRSTSSNLIRIYEKLINRDHARLINDLINKSKIYNQFLEAEKYSDQIHFELLELDRIGATPSYQLLLYLFSLDSSFFEENKEECLIEVIKLLQKYYIRRNITDTPPTRALDSINIKIIEYIAEKISSGQQINKIMIKELILSKEYPYASLDNFKKEISDNIFYYYPNMARYLLTLLDRQSQTKEYNPNLWARDEKGRYIWTIEHIFPQGHNIPKAWVDMIAGGDIYRAKSIQEQHVHCFGNLTLSAYNSNLSNKSFAKKRKKIDKSGLQIGYENGLALNNIKYEVNERSYSLATTEKWTEEHIKARNKVMVNKIVELVKFDSE